LRLLKIHTHLASRRRLPTIHFVAPADSRNLLEQPRKGKETAAGNTNSLQEEKDERPTSAFRAAQRLAAAQSGRFSPSPNRARRKMAELSLTLPVFIASPQEVMAERECAEQAIRDLARTAAIHRLLVYPFRWEKDYYPASGQPQPPLSEHLRRAEHVVIILWKRVGAGTAEELDLSLLLAQQGKIDNVAIYFKSESAGGADSPEILKLRNDLIGGQRALTCNFRSTEEFQTLFKEHLQHWLNRWLGVPACCQFALENSTSLKGTTHMGENRLDLLRRTFKLESLQRMAGYLGEEAVNLYQSHGTEALRQPLSRPRIEALDAAWHQAAAPRVENQQRLGQMAAQLGMPFVNPRPLQLDEHGNIYFADAEWLFYFCALGLINAIRDGRVEAVANRPYVNPVHQYLSAHVQQQDLKILPTLQRWLLAKDGATKGMPVARNFAAYVIGMIGATEAQDALAEALRVDPGKDVATYCITSLGKLRSRRHLPLLIRLFQENYRGLGLVISQAVSNIVGIANYPL
jgi:hypothetical protein